ncbi:hypothetical protein [Nocardia sp. BMG51109]|uniref:hypothetical protein n=1 Tax=Nocardia sp. BMG51109 TaxID=1056816 RepID=UPI0004659C01|nr:hypothetical protein [Nocardia sp. BMG51109]
MSNSDLRWQLADRLRVEMAYMNQRNLEVRRKLRYVDEFSKPDSWDVITPEASLGDYQWSGEI